MNDLDKLRTEKDSRRRAAELGHATRYSEAVDRYLGAAAYRLGEPEPAASPAPARTNTGVVLVGVDETPTSYTALDHAAIEAELHGWDLRVLHVQRPGGLRRPSRDTGDRLLERLTDRVRAYSPSVAVTSRLVVGSPARTLLAEGKCNVRTARSSWWVEGVFRPCPRSSGRGAMEARESGRRR
jgi:hypothetical protein